MSPSKPPLPARQPELSPRERTMAQMRRLLSAPVLGGAALGAACASCGDSIVCDPLPPPIQCPDGSFVHDLSQCISDPLPPPIVCTTNMSTGALWQNVAAGAQWQSGAGWSVAVSIEISTGQGGRMTVSGSPTATNGVVANVVNQGTSVSFDLTPDAGALSVALRIPTDCDGIANSLGYNLDVSGAPVPGGAVPIAAAD